MVHSISIKIPNQYLLTDEELEWLRENCKHYNLLGRFNYNHTLVYFKNAEEELLYRLRWE